MKYFRVECNWISDTLIPKENRICFYSMMHVKSYNWKKKQKLKSKEEWGKRKTLHITYLTFRVCILFHCSPRAVRVISCFRFILFEQISDRETLANSDFEFGHGIDLLVEDMLENCECISDPWRILIIETCYVLNVFIIDKSKSQCRRCTTHTVNKMQIVLLIFLFSRLYMLSYDYVTKWKL